MSTELTLVAGDGCSIAVHRFRKPDGQGLTGGDVETDVCGDVREIWEMSDGVTGVRRKRV